MIILLITIYLFVFLFSMLENTEQGVKYRRYVFIGIGLVLISFAAFRPIGFDNDSEQYELNFYHYDSPNVILFVEFTYRWLSRYLSYIVNDVHIVFLFYAILGISLKLEAIKKLSSVWMLPLLVYMGNYYILQDLTQIRAGVASGILLASIVPLADNDKRKCIFMWLIAFCFHYSSIILFPLLLLDNKNLTVKYRVALAMLIPAGYVIFFSGIDFLTILPFGFAQDKINVYQSLKDKGIAGEDINVFGWVFLVKVMIYLYTLFMYETVYAYNKYIPILLKIMGLSIFLFLALGQLPVLSFRLSELYGVVDIIIFANIYYIVKPAFVSKIIVAIIGFSMLAINVFYTGLLK